MALVFGGHWDDHDGDNDDDEEDGDDDRDDGDNDDDGDGEDTQIKRMIGKMIILAILERELETIEKIGMII